MDATAKATATIVSVRQCFSVSGRKRIYVLHKIHFICCVADAGRIGDFIKILKLIWNTALPESDIVYTRASRSF